MIRLHRGLPLLVLCLSAACRVTVPGPLPEHAGPELQRDAGHAVLMRTLRDEARVAGLLSIKDVPDATAALVRRVAVASDASLRMLEGVQSDPPAVDDSRDWLTAPEIGARARISERTTISLLAGRGRALEIDLILSQLKATEYISALALTLSDDDPSEPRSAMLAQVGGDFLELHRAFRSRLAAIEPPGSVEDRRTGD